MKKIFQELHEKYKSELFEYVLPFWESNCVDVVNGGIYNCLDCNGNIYSTDKSVWAQGRAAWFFSNLCNIYGTNKEWLDIAKNCLDFLTDNCIDKNDDRMYFTVTCDGVPLRKRRYFFSEVFYLLGCAEYSLASGDKKYLEIARKYYDFVWNIYLNPENDPFKIHPKTFSQTRSTKSFAEPMILLNATAVMSRCDKDNLDTYNNNKKQIISEITTKFVNNDLKCVLESVGPNGEFISQTSQGRVVNPGHAIEGSWFLLNEYENMSDEQVLKTAEDMFNWSIDIGWDKELEGISYFKDILDKPPEQYEHDMKLWWPHCEALIASLMLYEKTKKESYFDWFKKIDKYTFEKFSDHKNGDWYGYLHRDGSPTLPACKGSTYKSGFHVIRALIMVEQLLLKLSN